MLSRAVTASRISIFIVKVVYIFSVGLLGLYRITNTRWNTGIWWDAHLKTMGEYSAITYLFSFSALKWNLIVLIPVIEISTFLLLRKHAYSKHHLYLLFFYHFFMFFILTPRNAPLALYWTPFLQIACLLFFLPKKTFLFIKKGTQKPLLSTDFFSYPSYKPQILIPSLLIFIIVQCSLPLWPYLFFHEDINWTLKGTHFAWRMKINSIHHDASLVVLNKKTKEKISYNIAQINFRPNVSKYSPYALIYYAHALKDSYAKEGQDVAIYANAFASLNSRPYYRYIDPTVDLSMTSYHFTKSNSFIIPRPTHDD